MDSPILTLVRSGCLKVDGKSRWPQAMQVMRREVRPVREEVGKGHQKD